VRILYDHQIFIDQPYGGASRYFSELVKEAKRNEGLVVRLSLHFSSNAHAIEEGLASSTFTLRGLNFRGKTRVLSELNQLCTLSTTRRFRPNLFHPTHYADYFLGRLPGVPYVLTVFDLIYELFPQYFHDPMLLERKRRLVAGARRIIAISECTKRDLVRLYGIDSAKVDVVHLSTRLKRPESASQDPAGLPYVLFVGNRGNYKSFVTLAQAFARLPVRDRNRQLVCAGGGQFTHEEQRMLDELDIRGRTRYVPIGGASLAAIYAGAGVFVFPSLYEGFGIPMLEAFACGCPAIASDVPSLREVGREAAEYFDPASHEGLCETMERVLWDLELRSGMVSRGLIRSGDFSGPKMIQQTIETYTRATS